MHPDVEAGGMWYCPNLLCSGPGAGWFRSTLESYKESSNGSHTVDSNEWIYKAKKYIKENPDKKNVLILWDEA